MRKENVKKCKKLFTKNECNNIIRKKYNPLRAKKIEREGLFMKEKDEVNAIAKELSKKYKIREEFMYFLINMIKKEIKEYHKEKLEEYIKLLF